MRHLTTSAAVCLTSIIVASCDDAVQPTRPAAPATATTRDLIVASSTDALSGGATTVFDSGPTAFGHPSPNLDATALARHNAGDAAFGQVFTPSTGLGPLYNNTACEACHVGDGRGRPPLPAEDFATMLFRASVKGHDANGGPNPAGVFGGQLQLLAIPGYMAEAAASVSYSDTTDAYSDGTTYTLHVPHYSFTGTTGPLPDGLLTSPRVAPVNFGLGLLEAIPQETILANADPTDANADGISGKANMVWDVPLQQYVIGRFGWKANVGSLLQQAAGAFNGDMGITTAFFPSENCEGEYDGCAPHAHEISKRVVADVAFYTQTLGVPARRGLDDPLARRGERMFYNAGCDGCHTPTMQTGVLAGVPSVSNQTIHAYTDLLLHNMGATLADGRPDFDAGKQEFRTAPLWGIGLVSVVNGHTFFLHDGRARNLTEAVLWHGGEARKAREAFKAMTAAQRAALIAFLNSL